MGNVDYDADLPVFRVLETDKLNIYMCHGHIFDGNPERIAKEAKMNNCSLALFGHTHRFYCQYIDDILVVNPGSCSRSKDGPNSYAIVSIENNEIKVSRVNI